MTHRIIWTFLLTLSFAAGISQVAAQDRAASGAVQDKSQPVLQSPQPRYQLNIGDVLELGFPFTPEYNQKATVQPDGFINLRDMPDQHVAGKTTAELAEQLRAAYGKILHDPVIVVQLSDFEKPYFIVSGQVSRPGKYDLRGNTTATQAIAIAGGFPDSAKHSEVLLFRRVSNEWTEVKKLDMKKMLRMASLMKEDLQIRPGDMLFVPKNKISKIKPFIPNLNVGMYANQF
jgi:polysaccharide biosynthesis/export protein